MFGIPRLLSNSGVVGRPLDADVDNDGSLATPGTGLHPDGGVDINDIIAYNALFENGDVRGDLDNGSGLGLPDGGVGIDDLLYFFLRFEQGTRGGDLNDDRFLWRGYRWDPHLAIYHVRNRVFDPKTMHWLQPDPLGDVDGPNPYAYVGWDPFNGYKRIVHRLLGRGLCGEGWLLEPTRPPPPPPSGRGLWRPR